METNQAPQPPIPAVRAVQPFAFIGNGPENDAPSFTEYIEARKSREAQVMQANMSETHPSMFQADDVPDERTI